MPVVVLILLCKYFFSRCAMHSILDPDKERIKKSILLLEMVFSDQLLLTRGQEFRDRVRCIQLQRLDFNVCTVDDKHKDDYLFPGLHCNAIFNQARGFISQIRGKWGNDVKFSHIILDYFFSPVSWARERWSPKFFFLKRSLQLQRIS